MLASSGPLPTGPDWAYEFKWDGVRAIASRAADGLRLFARTGAEITAAYPEVLPLAGQLEPGTVLDGEIVLLDAAGRPSFVALGERMHVRDRARAAALAAGSPVTYMIFDLLHDADADADADATGQPWHRRRARLEQLRLGGPNWVVPPVFTDGPATLAAAREHDLEGVMAKRVTAAYRPGQRTRDWVKVKFVRSADLVVGGWRPGARAIGGLLVGVPTAGGLRYRGRVGGGISAAAERALLTALEPLLAPTDPFADVPRDVAAGAVWVRPEVVVEVRYGQLTPDGRLRFPSFLRIRPDVPAAAVVEPEETA
ncbi:ATP-dependent DNA ligase [Pilimelia columellifera subsp. columellifera]|uniref:DNA ligase (ATP) n=2 Tax=Pilimelia TaxID=53370 RepID=A0ABP6A7M9_9ACTN